MKEKTISSVDELIRFVNDCSNKNLFFRGEIKDNETFCLPSKLREGAFQNYSREGESGIIWFTEKLEPLGIKTPYFPCKGNSEGELITNALLNISPNSWYLWNEDKAKALLSHYSCDFEELEKINNTNPEYSVPSYPSSFLDITSDILVALHFACSKYVFYKRNEMPPSNSTVIEDGYLYIFDLKNIENAEHLRLVDFPSYAYFYKTGDEYQFQPFDRITHQRGAFLVPKNKNICRDDISHEIQNTYLTEKIILKSNVKEQLYKIFGGKDGLSYYFPIIKPMFLSEENDILKSYQDLEGITIIE